MGNRNDWYDDLLDCRSGLRYLLNQPHQSIIKIVGSDGTIMDLELSPEEEKVVVGMIHSRIEKELEKIEAEREKDEEGQRMA